MARQCEHCGNEMRDGLKFCPKCGKAQGGARPKPTGKPVTPPIQQNTSNKSIMLVGVIVVALIIGAGLGYYIFTNQKKEVAPVPSLPTTSDTPRRSDEKGATNSQQPNAPWNVLVREKNDIDLAIGELAAKINKYLNTHPDFRSADDLKREARVLMDRAKTAEDHVKKTEGIDSGRRDALINLFSLEAERVQGLYKGMIDNSNGGDYSLGFQDGTRASYAFDEANAKFNSMYK